MARVEMDLPRAPQLEVRQHAVKGRCFYTKAAVSSGDVLLEAQPYAFVVDDVSRGVVCSGCGEPPALGSGGVPVPTEARAALPFGCGHAAAAESSCSASVGVASVGGVAAQPVLAPSLVSALAGDATAPSTATATTTTTTEATITTATEATTNLPPNQNETNPSPTSSWLDACGQLRYCSLGCARRDYARFHGFECATLRSWADDPHHVYAAATPGVRDFVRLLMRIVTRAGWEQLRARDRNLAAWSEPLDFVRDVMPLCDNIRAFPRDALASFVPLAQIIAYFAESHPLKPVFPAPDPETSAYIRSTLDIVLTPLETLILTLICKEECNSFGVYSYAYRGPLHERQCYGLCLYTEAVFFNHSCYPSVGHATKHAVSTAQPVSAGSLQSPWPKSIPTSASANPAESSTPPIGPNLLFFALRDLPPNTEVEMAYMPLEGSLMHRRTLLRHHFFFECECSRCVAEERIAMAEDTASNNGNEKLVISLGSVDGNTSLIRSDAVEGGSGQPELSTVMRIPVCGLHGCHGIFAPVWCMVSDSAKDLISSIGNCIDDAEDSVDISVVDTDSSSVDRSTNKVSSRYHCSVHHPSGGAISWKCIGCGRVRSCPLCP